jgi:NADH:ubiquinone oxidoreductase subunit 3 (subunit A)
MYIYRGKRKKRKEVLSSTKAESKTKGNGCLTWLCTKAEYSVQFYSISILFISTDTDTVHSYAYAYSNIDYRDGTQEY